jgi:hypothetical protein
VLSGGARSESAPKFVAPALASTPGLYVEPETVLRFLAPRGNTGWGFV